MAGRSSEAEEKQKQEPELQQWRAGSQCSACRGGGGAGAAVGTRREWGVEGETGGKAGPQEARKMPAPPRPPGRGRAMREGSPPRGAAAGTTAALSEGGAFAGS